MKNTDVIILAVQPQMLAEVLLEVKIYIHEKHLIISVAVGKSIDYLQQNLQSDTPIIRVMPNINAIVAASTTCFSISPTVKEQHKTIVATLFETIGSIIELPENLFTIFSAIGGASPAFTYLYIDSLARAAVREGIDKKMALEIAASSVLSSAKMILESNEHPWELVDQVCSPGGTTIQGVTSLQNDHFASTIYDAVSAVIAQNGTLS
ncbi:pyrroline-5-carboxylate reductase [Viridibacillus soli]|uniref:pyrroline-5-carboxylate reductase n=1 Tax=Viridibacillus soli TaxID=2798301 RepID=UPI001F279CBD|nr:pyrroline-5-carboxylate reductase [Viridibacillus soli]